METLTRLVSESLARHGFDRPLDYRRLQWSRWFRCQSHHSLLSVPSKPGVFAVAEEVLDFSNAHMATTPHVGTAAPGCPVPEGRHSRMLAVIKFFEDDDMAFVLDRMLSHQNPMRARLSSGRYFIRFVVMEDPSQRRTICSALNQWIVSSSEKATGIGPHFASSLEFTAEDAGQTSVGPANVGRTLLSATADATQTPRSSDDAALETSTKTVARLETMAAKNIHSAFPSGF